MTDSYCIALIGTISAGKTTLLNALACSTIGEVHTKKTTLLPNIFHTSTDLAQIQDPMSIIDIANKKNEEFIKYPGTKIEELHHNIDQIHDFIKFKSDIKITLYDIPGLNDSLTNEMYYEYVNNVFHNFDLIIWVIDAFSAINTLDEAIICNTIIQNIKMNNDTYGIKTKLLVLMNKCDDMYQLELDDEKLYMFNQAKKIIDDRIKSIYPEFKYDIMPISSENAYIYRLCQKNQLEHIGAKYLNKLGYNEYSRAEWNTMTQNEKIQKIKNKLTPSEIVNRITNTGFDNFKNVIQEYINSENEIQCILNKMRYNIIFKTNNVMQLKNQFINEFDHAIDTFVTCDGKISSYKTNDLFKNDNNMTLTHCVMFDNLKKLIYLYTTHIENYVNVTVIVNDQEHAEYINIKNINNKLMLHFNNLVENSLIEMHNKISAMINEYYFKKIRVIVDIPTKLSFIDDLMKNNYKEWKQLLVNSIIESEISKFDPMKQIEIIENIYVKYCLDIDEIISLVFNIIDIIYSNYFKKQKTNEIMYCLMYWNNVIVKSSNQYSFDIFKMKQGLNKYINMSRIDCCNDDTYLTKNCHLEQFLYKVLSHKYPMDYMTYDDLFNYDEQ